MQRSIILFTDFGVTGPYVGQVRAVLAAKAPGVPVIDLMADAPAFDPRASAYLLAALVPELPTDSVVMGVVDPGVGSERPAMVAEADGRLLVGPHNGLFELVMRRAAKVRAWRIVWRPQRLSATFHGRDLFAPVAARLGLGEAPEAAGVDPMAVPVLPHWPDDLPEIVYVDHYGNAMTGMRSAAIREDARLEVAGRVLAHARTYSAVPPGEAFWYGNSIGLVEVAVAQGSACRDLGLRVGCPVRVLA